MAQEYVVTFSGEDVKDDFDRGNDWQDNAPKVTVIINQYWDKEAHPSEKPKETDAD